MKKLWLISIPVVVVLLFLFTIPVFAQTHIATLIPGQPLGVIAAKEIITHSGLPTEELADGITNSLTKGRDAINAYRYAHEQLSKDGWYRGIAEDHTPLLEAMLAELEKQGFTSTEKVLQDKSSEVLEKFWFESDTENAKELGYDSLEKMQSAFIDMVESGKSLEVIQLKDTLDGMWK